MSAASSRWPRRSTRPSNTSAKVDVVFANAGIANDPPTTLAAADLDAYERVINVDLHGVIRTIKPALPEIIANQGHVLITASVYAFVNGVANSAYAASKAAVEMLGRSLRLELAPASSTPAGSPPHRQCGPWARCHRHRPHPARLPRTSRQIHRTRGDRDGGRRRHPDTRSTGHPPASLAPHLSAPRHRRRRHRPRDASRPHDPPPHKPARTRSHHAPTPLETACAHGRATLPRSGESRSTSSTQPTSLFAKPAHAAHRERLGPIGSQALTKGRTAASTEAVTTCRPERCRCRRRAAAPQRPLHVSALPTCRVAWSPKPSTSSGGTLSQTLLNGLRELPSGGRELPKCLRDCEHAHPGAGPA